MSCPNKDRWVQFGGGRFRRTTVGARVPFEDWSGTWETPRNGPKVAKTKPHKAVVGPSLHLLYYLLSNPGQILKLATSDARTRRVRSHAFLWGHACIHRQTRRTDDAQWVMRVSCEGASAAPAACDLRISKHSVAHYSVMNCCPCGAMIGEIRSSPDA